MKQWYDHAQPQGVELEQHSRDATSREKVRRFRRSPCRADQFAEYEAYAVLSFRRRAAQDATLRGVQPPNPPEWLMQIREWQVRIVTDRGHCHTRGWQIRSVRR